MEGSSVVVLFGLQIQSMRCLLPPFLLCLPPTVEAHQYLTAWLSGAIAAANNRMEYLLAHLQLLIGSVSNSAAAGPLSPINFGSKNLCTMGGSHLLKEWWFFFYKPVQHRIFLLQFFLDIKS